MRNDLYSGSKEGIRMSTEIYYFSGTGNTFAVARDIANEIGGKLKAIPMVIKQESIHPEGEVIGIVFPVYHQGLPYIIRRFINKIDNLNNKYIFGVCTYGGSPGISLEYLDNCIKLKGGKLSAGFAVRMPYNYVTPSLVVKNFFRSFKLRETDAEKCQKMYSDWKRKLTDICETILARKEGNIETGAKVIEKIIDLLNLRESIQKKAWLKIADFQGRTDLSFPESIQLMDHGFSYDGKCNGCGTCVQICPVDNIIMINSRPSWQHRCEQCFACLQWCPEEAIQFSNRTSFGKRYHHTEVNLLDMIYDKDG